VGDFKQPGATAASRAGKRPFLIAKQFCFQQRFGNRPAVDCNKRMRLFALSRIVAGKIFPMNRLGRQLFARPRFPSINTAALERAYSKIVCRTCSICGD